MRRRGQHPAVPAPESVAGLPQPRQANPEPMIPAPKHGCEWCGSATGTSYTMCEICTKRERAHRERMIALAEREAELRNQLLEQQLENDPGRPES